MKILVRILVKYLTLLLSLLVPYLCYASATDKLMDNLIPKDGMYNKTKAAVIKDQSGGFVTGGSLLIRGPAPKELQPLMIQIQDLILTLVLDLQICVLVGSHLSQAKKRLISFIECQRQLAFMLLKC
jgi:hypothetical protein